MRQEKPTVIWNDKVRLGVVDVDETIADVYTPAKPEMIDALSSFLAEDRKLFMVTGGSLARVRADITDLVDPKLRHGILISHCSGAEVFGFTKAGDLRDKPFYSIYEEVFSARLKKLWRDKVKELLSEFGLRPHPVRPVLQFRREIGVDPLDIMLDDRGPQITLEFVNGYDLSEAQSQELEAEIPETHGSYDLRIPVLERAETLLADAEVPITTRLGGVFALDLAVKGVSKANSIRHVLDNPGVLATIGLETIDLQNPRSMEVWGDKFSVVRGGTDRHMSEALPPEVRSIDFRVEDPAEFPKAIASSYGTGNTTCTKGY